MDLKHHTGEVLLYPSRKRIKTYHLMKFLFQMDDPQKININEDSTYMLIRESLRRGIECYYNDPSWVFSEINKVNKIINQVQKYEIKTY